MKLYISDLSLYVLMVTYLPLVIYLLVRLLLNKNISKLAKTVSIAVGIPIAYAIPFGDVTLNSMAMTKACPKAGLYVYKKVEVDGFLDSTVVPRDMARDGYQFMETYVRGGGYARFDLQGDGEIIRTEMDEPTAEYEVRYEVYSRTLDGTFRRLYSGKESFVYKGEEGIEELPVVGGKRYGGMERWHARNRITKEVVGEWITFSPLHGWVDRIFLHRLFGASLSGCNGRSRWPKEHYGKNFRTALLPSRN
ncbi:MAG: hypothetical protein ABW166_10415 [Sedimenticola sp.]